MMTAELPSWFDLEQLLPRPRGHKESTLKAKLLLLLRQLSFFRIPFLPLSRTEQGEYLR